MRDNNFENDFGDEISRAVKSVFNARQMNDLKRMINDTVRHIPGMEGSSPFPQTFWDDNIKLSEEETFAEAERARTGGLYGNPAARQSSSLKGSVSSVFLILFGAIGAVPLGFIWLSGLAITIFDRDFMPFSDSLGVLIVVGIPLAACVAMLFGGIRIRKRLKRFKQYQRVLNGNSFCEIDKLAAVSRLSPAAVVKDIRKMAKAGLFSEAYLDEKETCLMTDYDTYQQYLTAKKSAEQSKREEAERKRREQEKWASQPDGELLRQTVEDGKAYVRQIKAANDALPEAEISEKLDRLETITSKIFNYVEEHPEKLPEIRKFMCYYMPITLKLVKAYQEFELHGGTGGGTGGDRDSVGGGSVKDTQREIKETLETINKAYQNLLLKLMQADILDVSSDLSALETILAQDGLTD